MTSIKINIHVIKISLENVCFWLIQHLRNPSAVVKHGNVTMAVLYTVSYIIYNNEFYVSAIVLWSDHYPLLCWHCNLVVLFFSANRLIRVIVKLSRIMFLHCGHCAIQLYLQLKLHACIRPLSSSETFAFSLGINAERKKMTVWKLTSNNFLLQMQDSQMIISFEVDNAEKRLIYVTVPVSEHSDSTDWGSGFSPPFLLPAGYELYRPQCVNFAETTCPHTYTNSVCTNPGGGGGYLCHIKITQGFLVLTSCICVWWCLKTDCHTAIQASYRNSCRCSMNSSCTQMGLDVAASPSHCDSKSAAICSSFTAVIC